MNNTERLAKLKQAESLIREVEFSYPHDEQARRLLYQAIVNTFGTLGQVSLVVDWLKESIKREKNENRMDKMDIIEFQGTSDDLIEDSPAYFAMRAWETQGDAIRDNSFEQWVAIGKRVESEGSND